MNDVLPKSPRYTDEFREKVYADLDAGTMTNTAIASKYGIHVSSIANWIKKRKGIKRNQNRQLKIEKGVITESSGEEVQLKSPINYCPCCGEDLRPYHTANNFNKRMKS